MSLFNNNNNTDFNRVIAKAKTKNKSSNNGLHPYIKLDQQRRKQKQNQNKSNREFFGLNSENNFVPKNNSSPAKNNKKNNKNVSTYNSRKNQRLSKKNQTNLFNNNNLPEILKQSAENNKLQKRLNNLRKNPNNPNNKTFTANTLIRPGVESAYPLNTNTNTNTNNNFNFSSLNNNINNNKSNLFNNNNSINNIIAKAGPRTQQKNDNRNNQNNQNFFKQFDNSLQVQNLPYQNNMLTPNATHILTHSSKKNNRTKTRRPRNRRETFNNNLLKNYVDLNGNKVRESERRYSKNIPNRSRLKNTRNAITRKTKKNFSLFGRKVKNTSKSISKKTKKGFNSLKRSAKSIKKSFSSKGKSEEKRLQVLNKKIDELNDKIARYLLVQLRAQTTMNPREVNRLTSSGKMVPLNKMNCLINKLRMELVGLENERNTIVPPNDETCVYQ